MDQLLPQNGKVGLLQQVEMPALLTSIQSQLLKQEMQLSLFGNHKLDLHKENSHAINII
jgi:hypothetical protein